jgi:hypothetical protein
MEEVRGRRTWDRRAHDDGQHSDSDDERIMTAILVTRYYSGTASCCGKGYIGSMAAIGGRLNVSHISVGCECTRSASPTRPAAVAPPAASVATAGAATPTAARSTRASMTA